MGTPGYWRNSLMIIPVSPTCPCCRFTPLTINGMCYAISVNTLAQVGGFAAILHDLADDLALATLLRQHHIRLIQSTAPVRVQTSLSSGKSIYNKCIVGFCLPRYCCVKNSADKTDYISATGAASFTHVGDVTHCWMGVGDGGPRHHRD